MIVEETDNTNIGRGKKKRMTFEKVALSIARQIFEASCRLATCFDADDRWLSLLNESVFFEMEDATSVGRNASSLGRYEFSSCIIFQ